MCILSKNFHFLPFFNSLYVSITSNTASVFFATLPFDQAKMLFFKFSKTSSQVRSLRSHRFNKQYIFFLFTFSIFNGPLWLSVLGHSSSTIHFIFCCCGKTLVMQLSKAKGLFLAFFEESVEGAVPNAH